METGYYYALTDERGVLCVDELNSGHADEELAAKVAAQYPDNIYFMV